MGPPSFRERLLRVMMLMNDDDDMKKNRVEIGSSKGPCGDLQCVCEWRKSVAGKWRLKRQAKPIPTPSIKQHITIFHPLSQPKPEKEKRCNIITYIIFFLSFLPTVSYQLLTFQEAIFLIYSSIEDFLPFFFPMDSFNHRSGFRYNLNADTVSDANGDSEFSGILEIYVHNARNIHNICIYDKQDVYAKFSLTYNPDEIISTRVINGGGKNPDFNENLRMKVTQLDAVLKCEIWMLSRARNLMEDQLLGFALVPISQVIRKGKLSQDYSLSSTDLFHSPAGTVQLTLSLNTSLPISPSLNPLSESSANSSITSEVVLLDRKISEVILDPIEYCRVEFPDINVVRENQQMVSEYFDLARHGCGIKPGSGGVASFLHLGASPQLGDDYEMTLNSSEETISPNGSIQNSGFFSSTTTSLSDDKNSSDSIEKRNRMVGESSNSGNASVTTTEAGNHGPSTCPDTPTSRKGSEARDEKESKFSCKEEEEDNNNNNNNNKGEGNLGSSQFGQVFSAPLGNINLEAEQSAMQQQIVDMYMRSMQQFTESLANMKLPMEVDKTECQDRSEAIQNHNNKLEVDKKKDGSRVFYGSRAFF
ncbi:uncharacterized protein LOC115720469 isoform X1 [Cannabis sativa]|uniref:uncharacterized protein LOC115720469 isoform X1 n=2 Tax=Cannabis sativa TaxID=3483 RepID=UPI0029C9F1E0|nr:uncharacterized protein LOC115720469 isoform X1 [Cannabis sativa]